MFVNRTKQSIRNIRVSLCFSILILVLRFFSRKVFIDHIGIEVLGLNTALTSLLNLLNLTELGIGSAVSYFLYIPLAQSDCKTVNEIVSLQGWLYKRVTYVILVGSIVLMSFFPWIFSQMKLPLWYAYGSFGVLLIGAILGYIINYAQILLSADQQIYKIGAQVHGRLDSPRAVAAAAAVASPRLHAAGIPQHAAAPRQLGGRRICRRAYCGLGGGGKVLRSLRSLSSQDALEINNFRRVF